MIVSLIDKWFDWIFNIKALQIYILNYNIRVFRFLAILLSWKVFSANFKLLLNITTLEIKKIISNQNAVWCNVVKLIINWGITTHEKNLRKELKQL